MTIVLFFYYLSDVLTMQASLIGASRLLTAKLKDLKKEKDKEVINLKGDNLDLKKSLDVVEA